MDEKERIKVSVCCVAYNHEPYLRQCLEGLLMQKTSFKYEILIHDDASTDGTTGVIREYAATYPDRIFPLIQTENQYSTKTRAIITTYLLPLARGKYIALCEGDDYWTDPLKLQKQVDVLEADSGISICTHLATTLYTNGREKVHIPYKESRVVPLVDIIRRKQAYWPTASFVYRKELMKNYPAFCLNCHAGDAPLILYMAVQGKVYYLNEVMSVYRRRTPGSHTYRAVRLNDTTRRQTIQTELDMLDGFNARTNYEYNVNFINRKVYVQSAMLARRRTWRINAYNGFYDDLRLLPLKMRIKSLIKIYLLPILRGNIFRTEKGKG